MDVRGGATVDQQTEQFGPAVVAARVHQLLALDDQREVEVGDDDAFARAEGLTEKASIGRHDRGKQPPEIGPMLQPVSLMICSCWFGCSQAVALTTKHADSNACCREPGYMAEWICSPSAI